MSENNGNLLNAALAYAKLGYPVFPCAPKTKKPLTEHGFLNASTDPKRIEQWWSENPQANIGIPTEGLLVIDIDGQNNSWLADDPDKMAELAEWDYDLLPIELGELQQMDFDLEMLGFDKDELATLLNPGIKEGLTDPDEVPEPPDEAITKPGDLWTLGEHRLLCGDAGKTEDVDRLLDGAKIQLVNTDPPYNVNLEPRSNNALAAADSNKTHHQKFDEQRFGKRKATHKKLRPKDRRLENDYLPDKEFEQLLRVWFGQMARVLEPGRGFYIWGGYANCKNYPAALAECGLYFSQAVIWVKQHPVMTRKDFMGNHEWCFYGWREGAAHWFTPDVHNATDVWEVKKVSPNKMIHLTEKPVELAVRAIQYSSRPGENVLDTFGGSGSTLIACEQTGRYAFLMELDALYTDVIVQRWEKFTGKKAERIAAKREDAQ